MNSIFLLSGTAKCYIYIYICIYIYVYVCVCVCVCVSYLTESLQGPSEVILPFFHFTEMQKKAQ